jgi:hypothetical protein
MSKKTVVCTPISSFVANSKNVQVVLKGTVYARVVADEK